jgi:hypothetical protein
MLRSQGKIRQSRGFELVDFDAAKPDTKGFAIHIISIDTSLKEAGSRSSLAIAYTFHVANETELYENLQVIDVGRDQVDGMATDILGEADRETEFLQH